MAFWYEYLMFLSKVGTLVVAFVIVLGFGVGQILRLKSKGQSGLTLTHVNEMLGSQNETFQKVLLDKADFKKYLKEKKQKKKSKEKKPRLFVLRFDGDLKATRVEDLREEITAILMLAKPQDEVLVVLESSGGTLPGYGLAASQLARFRENNIPLTVAVDQVAASGGYLMAVVANRILSAPFAIIGSIGVIAQLPNFHRLLEKHNIDYEMITAGEYKRTLTLFGKNTDKGREKFKEEITLAHKLFKEFILKYRPSLDIETVATGEYWPGQRALELGLVDALQSSDDYLLSAYKDKDIYQVTYESKEKLSQKLAHFIQKFSLNTRQLLAQLPTKH